MHMNLFSKTLGLCLFSLSVSCSSHDPIYRKTYSADIAIQAHEKPPAFNKSVIARRIHELTNDFRRKQGLHELASNSYLDKASLKHSYYMRDDSNNDSNTRLAISHDNGKQRAATVMMDTSSVGFAENVGALHRVRENQIAEKMVEGWIESKGHLKNIMGDYDELGVGVTQGNDYEVFATQIFTKRRVYPTKYQR